MKNILRFTAIFSLLVTSAVAQAHPTKKPFDPSKPQPLNSKKHGLPRKFPKPIGGHTTDPIPKPIGGHTADPIPEPIGGDTTKPIQKPTGPIGGDTTDPK